MFTDLLPKEHVQVSIFYWVQFYDTSPAMGAGPCVCAHVVPVGIEPTT